MSFKECLGSKVCFKMYCVGRLNRAVQLFLIMIETNVIHHGPIHLLVLAWIYKPSFSFPNVSTNTTMP